MMTCEDKLSDRQLDCLVSVIVPIYNTEQYLAECIESILNQTHTNIEIILIDDGSTDRSGEIADEYAKKDKRIRVIHKENEGVSATRNVGIDIAVGEWIAFIDSDDTVNKEYIEVLLKNALDFKVDISFGISNIMDEDGNKRASESVSIVKESCTSESGIIHLLEADIFGCAMNKLYRAILWKNYRIQKDIHINEDLLANYFCFSQSNNVVYTNEKLYNYRIRNGSASRSGFDERQFDIVKVNKKILEHSMKYWTESDVPQYAGKRYVGSLISIYKGACAVDDIEIQKQIIRLVREDIFDVIKNRKISFARKVQCLMLCSFPLICKQFIRLKISV